MTRLNHAERTALRLAAAAVAWTVLFLVAMALMACTAPVDDVTPTDCGETSTRCEGQ